MAELFAPSDEFVKFINRNRLTITEAVALFGNGLRYQHVLAWVKKGQKIRGYLLEPLREIVQRYQAKDPEILARLETHRKRRKRKGPRSYPTREFVAYARSKGLWAIEAQALFAVTGTTWRRWKAGATTTETVRDRARQRLREYEAGNYKNFDRNLVAEKQKAQVYRDRHQQKKANDA